MKKNQSYSYSYSSFIKLSYIMSFRLIQIIYAQYKCTQIRNHFEQQSYFQVAGEAYTISGNGSNGFRQIRHILLYKRQSRKQCECTLYTH